MSYKVKLSEEEIEALLLPIEGAGGMQPLHRRLQKSLGADGRLVLDEEDFKMV